MAGISVNELTTYRWSFEEDVQHYAEVGADGIAVWRQKISDFGEEKGIELIAETGLDVSALLWAGGFTGSDGRSYKDSVADAKEAIQLAAAMRAGCLVVYSGARAGHTHSHARRLLNNALAELLPEADRCRVTLAIEPVHVECAREWTFLTDLDESADLIHAVDHPCLRLALDTYYFGHDANIERLAELAPDLAFVQLGDGRNPPDGEQDRCPLGDGKVPLGEIVRALRAGGYDGYFDIKLMGQEIETADYNELLRHCRAQIAGWLEDGC